jgi:hypothetical protein
MSSNNSLLKFIKTIETYEVKTNKIIYLSNTIMLLIWLVIYKYIYDLESYCDCSNNWKRDFVKICLFIFILNIIIRLINPKSMYKIINNIYLLILILILNIVFIIVSWIYIEELKDNNCVCSDNELRLFFEITNYLRFSIILIIIIYVIYIYYNLSKIYKKIKSIKSF